MECPVCLSNTVNVTLGCSHKLCDRCLKRLGDYGIQTCPICRADITPLQNNKPRNRRRDLTYAEFRERRLQSRKYAKLKRQRKDTRLMKTLGLDRFGGTVSEVTF